MVRCTSIPDFNFRFLTVTNDFTIDYIIYRDHVTSCFVFPIVTVYDFGLKYGLKVVEGFSWLFLTVFIASRTPVYKKKLFHCKHKSTIISSILTILKATIFSIYKARNIYHTNDGTMKLLNFMWNSTKSWEIPEAHLPWLLKLLLIAPKQVIISF